MKELHTQILMIIITNNTNKEKKNTRQASYIGKNDKQKQEIENNNI